MNFENIITKYIGSDYGISLGIGWYANGTRINGRAITVWGIDTVTDTLYVTDSDDQYTGLKAYHYNLSTMTLTDYYSGVPVLESLTALRAVALPAAALLFASGLAGLAALRKYKPGQNRV